ncbi:unnamed protein product [Choristocarpus tenellus]
MLLMPLAMAEAFLVRPRNERRFPRWSLTFLTMAAFVQGVTTNMIPQGLHVVRGGAGEEVGSPPMPTPCFGTSLLKKGPVKSSTRSIPVLRVGADGSTMESTVSRQMLAEELGCNLRDLRVADPTFPGQFPAILVRPGAIIVALANVRAIIKAGEMLLFPCDAEVMSIVPAVQEQVGTKELYRNGVVIPFEQIALECCLRCVCYSLQQNVEEVEPRLRHTLSVLGADEGPPQKSVLMLLPLKNQLDNLENTLTEVCKCMNDVLVNDEDMSMMYLTETLRTEGKPRDPSHHQEVEMLFENYLLQAELLRSDIRDFQDEARNTEEIVEIALDVQRNRILRFELVLSVSAFTVALGALVTGVFGMNLLSGWEEHPGAFWTVTASIYGGMLVSVIGAVTFCRRSKLL